MRILITVAGLMAIVGMTAVPVPSHEAARKDMRAILFHGTSLKATVRLDAQKGNGVGVALLIGQDQSDAIGAKIVASPDIANRACIGVAVFTLTGGSRSTPIADLKPDDAERHLWIYPKAGERPGLIVGKAAMPFDDGLMKVLDYAGVQYDSTSTACERKY